MKFLRKIKARLQLKKRVREGRRRHQMKRLAKKYPLIEDQVLFCSFRGKQYSDNPRAISEKLHELDPSVKILWLIGNSRDQELRKAMAIPGYVKVVEYGTPAADRAMVQSAVWVYNNDLPYGTWKRKNQYYIQTWHGDRGFKLVRYDAQAVMGDAGYKALYMVEDKICNLCVAGSDEGESKYRTAFAYHGEIMKEGCPRNDCLIHRDLEYALSIRKRLGLGDEQILLYAPTFRDQKKGKQKVDLDFAALKKALEESTGKPWKILVRGHSLAGKLVYGAEENVVMDVSGYRDMAELLMITDLLISDFSSTVNDYALMEKPIVLYLNDYEEYRKENRELKYDAGNLGYPVAYNMEELLRFVREMNSMDFQKICRSVLDGYGASESGRASEAVAGRILEFLKNNSEK